MGPFTFFIYILGEKALPARLFISNFGNIFPYEKPNNRLISKENRAISTIARFFFSGAGKGT